MSWEIRCGDALERLREMPDESVQCCVTSPPYWGLRDYGIPPTDWPAMTYTLPGGEITLPSMEGCLGLEPTPEQFVGHLTLLMREVLRVLRPDGTLWLNLGDSYAGGGCGARDPERWPKQSRNDHMPTHAKRGHGRKVKDLIGVPWLVAFALQADGWYLRAENIWHKLTPMPESVTDRTTRAHEQVFLLTKSARYFYDADAVRTPLAAKTLTTFGGERKQNGGGDLVKADNFARDVPNREAKRGEDGEPMGANLRSVWPLASKKFPEAHFATFPPDLVEPCILAGSPEKACSVCGAPWIAGDGERVLDLSRPQARRAQELADAAGLTPEHIDAIRSCGVSDAGKAQVTQTGFGKNDDAVQALADEAKDALGGYYREFLLARPSRGALASSCECDVEPAPSVVLDPFAGAATTGLVATRHNRDFIGIELNPEYVELGRNRIRDDAPLINTPAEVEPVVISGGGL